MDGLEFVASLVRSLAWPIAVLVVVYMLRKPLANLLTSRPIKRVKAGPGGLEIEYWDEAIKEAKAELETGRAEAAAPPVVTQEVEAGSKDFMEEMRALARVSPSAAVLESYARLERVVREVVEPWLSERATIVRPAGRPSSVRALLRFASSEGLLTDSELAAAENLIVLRNAAAHTASADLDADRAIDYAELVRQLILSILFEMGFTAAEGSGYL